MSLIPEFIFQTTIARGLDTLRKDGRYVDQLFKNIQRGDQEAIKEFLRTSQIDLSLNFPRTELSVPAIVILLKNENESQAFLGDSAGIDVGDFGYEGGIDGEVLGGVATTTSTSGYGELVQPPTRSTGGTNNTISVADGTFYVGQFVGEYNRYSIHLVGGTGAGQIRDISTNSASTIMVSENWLTNPDNTTIFEIRKPVVEILGDPAALYDNRNINTLVERKNTLYTNRYQIQLIGAHQEQTIYLYIILKAIFMLSRIFMEQQGLLNLRMSGTDFVNRPEYLPDTAYMRVLNAEFEHPFDIFDPVDPLIKKFTLSLCAEGEDAVISSEEVSIGPVPPTVIG